MQRPQPTAGSYRSHIRYQIGADAHLVTSESAFSARAVEVSVVGLRLKTDRCVTPGTEVSIRIELDEKVEIKGQISWVLNILNTHGLNYYDVGVWIAEMSLSSVKAAGIAARTEMITELLYLMKAS
jgi:CRISPR/Cas system-associated endonuclease Cas3-HD